MVVFYTLFEGDGAARVGSCKDSDVGTIKQMKEAQQLNYNQIPRQVSWVVYRK